MVMEYDKVEKIGKVLIKQIKICEMNKPVYSNGSVEKEFYEGFKAYLVGIYGMALVSARTPQNFFARIFLADLLPAFAEKQDNNEALCKAVLRITKIAMLFAAVLTTFTIF